MEKLPLGVHEFTPEQSAEIDEMEKLAKEEQEKLGRPFTMEESRVFVRDFLYNLKKSKETETFIGTKVLKGRPLNLGDYNKFRGWTIPENEDPLKPGFIVEYEDGYVSWSPEEVFNSAYRKTTDGTMDFGMATYFAKKGKRVARKGWNGSGMFAYLVPAASYPPQTGAARAYFGENAMVPYRAYWALKTVQDDVATWTPSGSDTLAEDWYVID